MLRCVSYLTPEEIFNNNSLKQAGYRKSIIYCKKIGNHNEFYYNNGKLIDNEVGEYNSRMISNSFVSSNDMVSNSININENKNSKYTLNKYEYFNRLRSNDDKYTPYDNPSKANDVKHNEDKQICFIILYALR